MTHRMVRTLSILAIVGSTSVAVAQDAAPPAPVDEYLAELDQRQRELKLRILEVEVDGDREDVRAAKDEYKDARDEYKHELDRLTTRDPALIGGGATLVALGGASLFSSLVLGMMTLFSGSSLYGSGGLGTGGRGGGYAVAAIGTAVGGVVGLSAGLPMLVIGLKRQPRDEIGQALVPPKLDTAQGVTLSWSF